MASYVTWSLVSRSNRSGAIAAVHPPSDTGHLPTGQSFDLSNPTAFSQFIDSVEI